MASWDGVNEFVAVAETESFTQAAEKLSTSVANVSRRVSALEERLAVKLLLRTTRKVSLTEAGQLYFQHCKPLLEGLEQAELTVSQLQSIPVGRLKITAPVTYGEQRVAPVLQDFLQQYPQLDLELILTNQKLDLIDSGIDVAVRLGQLTDSSFIARKLRSRRLYVCGSPKYLAQYGEPKTLTELSQHRCLVGTYDYWRFSEDQQARTLGVHGQIRCNSGTVLLDAALNGMGLVQLPDYYVDQHLASGALLEVLSQYQDNREGVWALYSESRHLSPKVRLVVDHLYKNL